MESFVTLREFEIHSFPDGLVKEDAILYEVIPSSGNVVSYGLLLISGGVLALAGIIVIIVGAILKRKI